MAELFGYTTTQQIVDPSSPTIQVQPNLQASNAFKSLGNLMDTAMQAKTKEVQNTRMIQNEVDQLKARIAADEKAKITAAKTAKTEQKALEKEQEDRDFSAFNLDFTGMDGDYERAMANAGDNVDLQYEAAAAYSLELRAKYNSLTEGLQARVSAPVNSKLRDIQKTIAGNVAASRKVEFYDNLHNNMPLVMQMSPENEAKYHKEIMDKAKVLGLPAQEVGAKYFTAQLNLVRSNMAENKQEIIQNYDVTSVDHAISIVDKLKKMDGRNDKEIKAAYDELYGIRKQVSDNAVSALQQFAQDGDLGNFNLQMAIVQDIGMVDTPELINLQQDFLNTYYSEKNVAERSVEAHIKNSGGTGSVAGLPDKVQNLFNAWMGQQVEEQIVTGQVNSEFFRKNSYNNPDAFATHFKAGFNVVVGQLKELAHEYTAQSKDKEAQAKTRAQIFEKVKQLNSLKNNAYGVKSDPLLYKSVVAETLLVNSNIANIPEALSKMDSMTEFKEQPRSTKAAMNVRDSVADNKEEAHKLFSALVELTGDTALAETAVIQRYSMQSIDGLEAEMSGGVVEFLSDNKISQKVMESWEKYLPEYLSSKGRTTSVENLQNVLKGTNPRALMEGNDIKYFNDEGSVARLPFSRSEMKDVAKFMNERFQQDNVPDAWDKLWNEVSTRASEIFYANGKTAFDMLKVPAVAVENAGVSVILMGETVNTMSRSFGTHFTTWLDNVRYQGMDAYQAKDLMLKSIEADWKKQVKHNSGIDSAANDAFVAAMAEAGKSIDMQLDAVGGVLNKSGEVGKDIVGFLGSVLETTFNAMIPKAEGSALTDANLPYWGQAEGTQLHFDKEVDGILTMPYGIVPTGGVTYTKDGVTKTIDARASGLGKNDLSNIDTSKATHKVGSTTVKRADYTSDENFAKAVFDAYETEAKSYFKNYDSLSDGQKKFIVDMAWNAGLGAAGWNDTKNAVTELSKTNPDYNKAYKVMQNIRTSGVISRGLLKRRAMSLNLMIQDNDYKIDSVKTYKLPNGKVRFSAITKKGVEIFVRDENQASTTLGTLAVPQ